MLRLTTILAVMLFIGYFPMGYCQLADLRSEKILLRIDSIIKAPIDTLLVSGSVWEASGLYPSRYSRYVYLELINNKDSVLDRRKWVCGPDSSHFSGKIPLVVDRLEGVWFIRAYTRLMCNFPETTFTILPFCKDGAFFLSSEERMETVDKVCWYPEGGHLVVGFPQTVAFQAMDKDRYPTFAEAVLVNAKGDTLATSLRTEMNGFGEFSFIPERGQSYYLRVGDYSYPGPEPLEIPVLQLRQNRNKVYYKILYPKGDFGKYEFVLFHRGQPCMSRLIEPGQEEGVIEASGLSSGILAGVVLKEGSRQLVSERLFYFQGVIDSAILNLNTEERAFLLLVSDLPSPVWNVSSYFDPTNERRHIALNQLMLAMKWGRFAWENVFDSSFQYTFPPEELLTLSGKIHTEMGRPLKEGTIVAINNSSGSTYDCVVEDGRFIMGVDDFTDQTTFFLQAYDQKGKSYNFSVLPDSDIFPPVVNPLNIFFPLKGFSSETYCADSLIRDYHLEIDGSKTYHIPEVMVATHLPNEEPSTKEFYGVNFIGEEVFEQPQFPNLIPYLDRMLGFKVTQEDTNAGVRYALMPTRGMSVMSRRRDQSVGSNRVSGEHNPNELIVLLDGRPVDTTWALQSIPSNDITSIERLTPAQTSKYVSHGISGAILLKTKKYKKQTVSSKGIIYSPLGLSNL